MKAQNDAATDVGALKALFGMPVSVPVGAVKIDVQPLGWFEAVAALEAIAPALSSMPLLPGNAHQDKPSGPDLLEWMHWISNNRGAVLRFCHLASGQSEADISRISVPDLLELVFGLVEVNADFFVRSLPGLMPRVGNRVESLMEKIASALKEPKQ